MELMAENCLFSFSCDVVFKTLAVDVVALHHVKDNLIPRPHFFSSLQSRDGRPSLFPRVFSVFLSVKMAAKL